MFTFGYTALYATVLLYGLFYSFDMLKIYLFIFTIYHILGFMTGKKEDNGFRRIFRIATWSPANDPSSYCKIELDIGHVEEFLEQENKKNQGTDLKRLTLTHVALKSIGMGFRAAPEDYGKIVFGKFVRLDDVDIACVINIGGKDLGQVTTRKCGKRGIRGIAESFKKRIRNVKKEDDQYHKNLKGSLSPLTAPLISIMTETMNLLNYNFGIAFPSLFVPKHQFGNIGFTNLSSFGLHEAFPPLVPVARSICSVSLCTPQMKPVVVDGKVEIRKIANMIICGDHRFQDGSGAAKVVKGIREVWSNPQNYI